MVGQNDELACVYAALILADDNIAITSDKINAILKAANYEVEPYWPGLFANALEGVKVKDLITNIGSGAGAAPAAAPAAAPVAQPAAKKVQVSQMIVYKKGRVVSRRGGISYSALSTAFVDAWMMWASENTDHPAATLTVTDAFEAIGTHVCQRGFKSSMLTIEVEIDGQTYDFGDFREEAITAGTGAIDERMDPRELTWARIGKAFMHVINQSHLLDLCESSTAYSSTGIAGVSVADKSYFPCLFMEHASEEALNHKVIIAVLAKAAQGCIARDKKLAGKGTFQKNFWAVLSAKSSIAASVKAILEEKTAAEKPA